MDIEAEARPEPDVGKRLYRYAMRVWSETDLPVLSVVLWLQPHGKPPSSPYRLMAGKTQLSSWRFWGIEVYKLEAETLFKPGLVGLLPLLPFTHTGGDEEHLERAAFDIYEQAPSDQMADLEALLATFGSRTVGRAVMRAILGRLPVPHDVLSTSPLYQEIVEEAQLQAKRQDILTILRQRFATLPPDVEAGIGQADLATAQAVLAHAVNDLLEQMRQRLGLPTS